MLFVDVPGIGSALLPAGVTERKGNILTIKRMN